jgi:tRNA1(Val) A37 N6-methylase TrmN6
MTEPGFAEVTEDMILGGQLRLRQPKRGHRAGHDAILLAAATPARGPSRGGIRRRRWNGRLALARRVSGLDLVLAEIDESLAALARVNAAANDISAQVLTFDVTRMRMLSLPRLTPDSADIVLMNPPFNDAERHRASPDPARQSAHVAAPDTLERWTACRAPGAEIRWRADADLACGRIAAGLAVLERGFGGIAILPVHPSPTGAAIRVIVTAVKGGRAPMALLPDWSFRTRMEKGTEAAAVLGGKAALALAGR